MLWCYFIVNTIDYSNILIPTNYRAYFNILIYSVVF